MEKGQSGLTSEEITSLVYHDIFAYPLTEYELVKWKTGNKIRIKNTGIRIKNQAGYYFLEGRRGLVLKRKIKERASGRKMEIAARVAGILARIPTVKTVAVTGALAMTNAAESSDIDLLIIATKETLWLTRLVSLICLICLRIPVRRFGEKDEKDKICLNLWLDENSLIWPRRDRNVYTAHEITQIIPLANKNGTYEKFIWRNRWVKEYWPNAVKIRPARRTGRNPKSENRNKHKVLNFQYLNIVLGLVLRASNLVAYKMQRFYMYSKITREVVTPTKAIFHPRDYGKHVLLRFQ